MRFALIRAHQCYLFMNSKHHKSDAIRVIIQLLAATTAVTYIRTQAVCAKRLNVERLHITVFNYQQRLLHAFLAVVVNIFYSYVTII